MMPGMRGASDKVSTNRLAAVRVGEMVAACAIGCKPVTLDCSEGYISYSIDHPVAVMPSGADIATTDMTA
jgi:hypothetical protein